MLAIGLLILTSLGYLAASVGFQFSLRKRSEEWISYWNRLIQLSLVSHTCGLIALTIQLQRLPMATMSEALSLLGWLLIACHLLLAQPWKLEALGSIAAPTAAILTGLSALALNANSPLPPRGPWFFLHVGSLIGSYAVFSLAAASALLYFVQARRLKLKRLREGVRLPALDSLDRAAYRFILAGFPLLVLGIVSGMRVTGWSWTWDAKETLVAVTGVIYLVYLHLRIVSGWRGRRVNLILLVAYCCVMISLAAPGHFHKF